MISVLVHGQLTRGFVCLCSLADSKSIGYKLPEDYFALLISFIQTYSSKKASDRGRAHFVLNVYLKHNKAQQQILALWTETLRKTLSARTISGPNDVILPIRYN